MLGENVRVRRQHFCFSAKILSFATYPPPFCTWNHLLAAPLRPRAACPASSLADLPNFHFFTRRHERLSELTPEPTLLSLSLHISPFSYQNPTRRCFPTPGGREALILDIFLAERGSGREIGPEKEGKGGGTLSLKPDMVWKGPREGTWRRARWPSLGRGRKFRSEVEIMYLFRRVLGGVKFLWYDYLG